MRCFLASFCFSWQVFVSGEGPPPYLLLYPVHHFRINSTWIVLFPSATFFLVLYSVWFERLPCQVALLGYKQLKALGAPWCLLSCTLGAVGEMVWQARESLFVFIPPPKKLHQFLCVVRFQTWHKVGQSRIWNLWVLLPCQWKSYWTSSAWCRPPYGLFKSLTLNLIDPKSSVLIRLLFAQRRLWLNYIMQRSVSKLFLIVIEYTGLRCSCIWYPCPANNKVHSCGEC